MPSPNSSRNGILFSARVSERSMSFNGRTTGGSPAAENLRRPKTVPDLKSAMLFPGESPANEEVKPKKLTKVLLNVTIQGSVGTVQVIISPEFTVKDLISAALKQYVKEGRRPVLSSAIADDFDLHYSQFSLESLDREEKIAELGSRNFFLCKKRKEVAETASSCAKQADQATKLASPCPPWLKFISFLF
ncbi:uncharacterized protein At4g22758-like [Chenopodium quinoa]|uniref:DUF7054 domain-containing protein n=1 Tax=Chenopodium quinoa TaxID=63459 RepID=A0A803M669_CHEQI|nr:uncharacterized protein At4g22758-like [Chenopodium quinoa]